MGVAVDLTAGTLAGAGQLVVGHPFDTIKVKLQSQPSPPPGQTPLYTGALDALRKTVAADGMSGLFKGMGAPLATVAVFNAVLFAARGQMERLLAHADGSDFTVGDQTVAGLGAGLAAAVVACPTELIKCRLQAQASDSKSTATAEAGTTSAAAEAAKSANKAVRYKGPMDVVKHVMRNEGGVVGLYKGMGATLLREVPGNAAMFGAYEWLKINLAKQQGLHSVSELGNVSLVAAGAGAGAAYWGSVYPADIIKSRLQVDSFTNPRYKGIMDCARQTYAAQGVGGLYKGFTPAFARSIPANATAFLVYEVVKAAMTKQL